jgi:hypothetical protein
MVSGRRISTVKCCGAGWWNLVTAEWNPFEFSIKKAEKYLPQNILRVHVDRPGRIVLEENFFPSSEERAFGSVISR